MSPSYDWEDDVFPKGVDVFVGKRRRRGIVHSRSLTANGAYVYGVRWKNASVENASRKFHEDVDCYCEARDMESMLF